MGGGCLGGLIYGIFGFASASIANNREQKIAKLEKAIKTNEEAERVMNLWGSTLKTASHEEKALFLASYLVLGEHQSNEGYFGNKVYCNTYTCSELVIMSCAFIEARSNKSLDVKAATLLQDYFGLPNPLLQRIADKVKFYNNAYQNGGIDLLCSEVLKILPNNYFNNTLADNETDFLNKYYDIEEKKQIEAEGKQAITKIIELINSELDKSRSA